MKKFRILALIWLVIVPLAMAPGSPPEKITLGPAKPSEYRRCAFPFCGGVTIQSVNMRDAVVHEIVYGPDGPLWQILEDGTAQYLHRDPRGNTVMLTDGAAAGVLERVTYDPYGAPRFQDPANQDKRDLLGVFLAESDYGSTQLFSGLWYEPEMGSRTGAATTDRVGHYRLGTGLYNPDEGRLATRPTVLEAETVHLSLQIDGNEVQGEGHAHGHADYIKTLGIVATAAIAIPNLIEARKGANDSGSKDQGFGFVTFSNPKEMAAIAIPNLIEARKGANESSSKDQGFGFVTFSNPDLYFSKVADDTSSCWIRSSQVHHSAAKVVVRGWNPVKKEMVDASSGSSGVGGSGGSGKVVLMDVH